MEDDIFDDDGTDSDVDVPNTEDVDCDSDDAEGDPWGTTQYAIKAWGLGHSGTCAPAMAKYETMQTALLIVPLTPPTPPSQLSWCVSPILR